MLNALNVEISKNPKMLPEEPKSQLEKWAVVRDGSVGSRITPESGLGIAKVNIRAGYGSHSIDVQSTSQAEMGDQSMFQGYSPSAIKNGMFGYMT